MKIFFITLEIISAIGIIITVLLHSAKGEGLGALGGSAHLFGSQKGLEKGLDILTISFAVIFIVSAIVMVAIS